MVTQRRTLAPGVIQLFGQYRDGGYDEVQVWPTGNVFYLFQGAFHRADGPAVQNVDGTTEYWLNGEKVSRTAFHELRIAS